MVHSLKYLLLFSCFAVLKIAQCKTIPSELIYPTAEELSFMKRYGYLPDEQDDVEFAYTARSVADALKKVQEFAGIPETGVLDVATKELFKKKRCGVKDIEDSSSRRRRYVIQRGWNKRTITYKILNGSSTMDKDGVEREMKRGLAIWAPHGHLNFVYQTNDSVRADIRVTFRKGDHGDGFAFDGPGQVVAHAFGPPHGGMHFDDDEKWGESTGDDEITDFYAVAVHEIGHALGLSHSSVKASVMYPYYQVPVEGLHKDDIKAMEKLYLTDQLPEIVECPDSTERTLTSHSTIAKATFADISADTDKNTDTNVFTEMDTSTDKYTSSYTSNENEESLPDRCDCDYDTLQVIQNELYVFQEEWMWVLNEDRSLKDGYPQRFHDIFKGLPENVDVIKTIYEQRNGHIVIFSGKEYWKFDKDFNLINSGSLSDFQIPSDVPELSTVFISNYNNKTYFIEAEQFWRYDESKSAMDPNYPKNMSAWRQVPYPINAAIVWKGETYMFRGPRFWRFDSQLVSVPNDRYPLPTAQIWLACPNTPDMQHYTKDED